MSMTESVTGVYQTDDWSLKAWWSVSQQVWLVQVEHRLPERGGWIRAWLAASDGSVARFGLLAEAVRAIGTFLEAPQWAGCLELSGVV